MKSISTLELRKQLLVLVVLIFVPVLGILLYTGFRQYQDTMADIENDAKQLIKLFIDEQVEIANQTNQFLKVLSHVPSVRNLELAGCNTFLQAIHKDNPQYSTIVVANDQGLIDCCAIPLKRTINVTDRSWFRRVRESRKFVIDNFLISRSAKKASLPFAYPVLSPDGKRFTGAVGAAFNLAYYGSVFEAVPLPPDSVIMLTDRTGKLLYQSFQEKKCLGKPLRECRGFDLPQTRNGRFQVSDSDGTSRIYWFERLWVGQETNEICLLIGIPRQVILADVRQRVVMSVAMLSIIALLSLAVAWFFGGRFILRPVNRLLAKTRQVREGDFSLPEPVGELPGELETLSQAFDEMILKLSQREEERDIALRQLQRSRDELEDRVVERTGQLKARNIELTRAKEMANAANNAKSEFLSNMSHELRTPLNSILGYVQVLNRDTTLTPAQKEGLDIILKSGNHLLTLINDVLDLAKIEAGKIEIAPEEVDLNRFLNGIAGIMQSRAREKEITFYYEGLTKLPGGITADPTRLRQVLLNLLGNAVKFTDKGGTVALRVSSGGGPERAAIRFEIEDTGRGIAPEEIDRIFEAFEQVGDVAQRSEGTGLGLNISRKLVRIMGAELQVRSELGKGTCFWFEISVPVTASGKRSRSMPDRKIISYRRAGEFPVKILIVDDKRHNRSFLRMLLTSLGFEIREADNGQRMIDQVMDSTPHMILTDLVMPVMTGFEAVRELRQTPAFADIPIIAMSASVLDKDKRESMIAGCDGFLPKPVDIRSLYEYMEKYLGLTWIYEDDKRAGTPVNALGDESNGVESPDLEKLSCLHEFAQRGNMKKIREYAEQMGAADQTYKPFAKVLINMANAYEELEIQALIERLMKEKQVQ